VRIACRRGSRSRFGDPSHGWECYVAYLFGEDKDGPHELSIDMFPEDGRFRVCGVREDGVTPFTEDAPLRN